MPVQEIRLVPHFLMRVYAAGAVDRRNPDANERYDDDHYGNSDIAHKVQPRTACQNAKPEDPFSPEKSFLCCGRSPMTYGGYFNLFTMSLKTLPRSSKSRNISKLAHMGLNKKQSPSDALRVAFCTASSSPSHSSRLMRSSKAWRILARASPMTNIFFTLCCTGSARTEKSIFLSRPPQIIKMGWSIFSSAHKAAWAVVALESSM